MLDFAIKDCQPTEHDLTVYVLGHKKEQFEKIKNRSYLKFVHLNQLEVGEYQRNDFAENRFFYTGFEKEVSTNYVGVASASWNEKYTYLWCGTRTYMVDFLHRLTLEPNVVWAAKRADLSWRVFSEWAHPGINSYLNEIEKITGIDSKGQSLWSNNFICHKDVMVDLINFFRRNWEQLNAKHQWDYKFECKMTDTSRLSGMLAERLSMYYWRSRTDLEIRQIEHILG